MYRRVGRLRVSNNNTCMNFEECPPGCTLARGIFLFYSPAPLIISGGSGARGLSVHKSVSFYFLCSSFFISKLLFFVNTTLLRCFAFSYMLSFLLSFSLNYLPPLHFLLFLLFFVFRTMKDEMNAWFDSDKRHHEFPKRPLT